MADIALIWLDGGAEVALDGADLLSEDGLQTSVIMSLFSDARASIDDELPSPGEGRRGYWGDQFSPYDDDQTGSKLWLLSREKCTPEVLERAKRYSEDSLASMLTDGVASSVTVATSFVPISELNGSGPSPHEIALLIEVQLTKPDGSRETFRFAMQWNAEAQRVN